MGHAKLLKSAAAHACMLLPPTENEEVLWIPTDACTGWCRPLILNKQKIVVAHAASAYKHSLREVFDNPGIASQIKVRLEAPPTRSEPQHPPCTPASALS